MEVLYKWHPTSLFFIRVEMRWARGHPLHPLRGQGEGRRCFLDSGLIVVLFITAVYIALGTIQLYYDEVHAWWVKQGWKNVQWILKFSLFIYLVYRVYSKNIIFFILVTYLSFSLDTDNWELTLPINNYIVCFLHYCHYSFK